MMNDRKRNFMFPAALSLLLMLLAQDASAFSPFTPVNEDVSIRYILNMLFGGAMPGDWGAGGADPFGEMFRIFNGAILVLGGVIVAYTLIVGTMQTAHDGEMLGKKWSSLWVPIRTVLGLGMVVPLGSGYCVAQLLVMWLVVQGVGLADAVWSAFTSTAFKDMSAMMNTPSVQVHDMATNALKIGVCMNGLKQQATNPDAAAIYGSNYQIGSTPLHYKKADNDQIVYDGIAFGVKNNANLKDVCGSYLKEYDMTATNEEARAGAYAKLGTLTAAGAAMGTVIPGVGTAVGAGLGALVGAVAAYTHHRAHSISDVIANKVGEAHKKAMEQLLVDLTPIANELTKSDGTGNPDPTLFDDAIKKYKDTIATAAMEQAGQNGSTLSDVAEQSAKDGWFLAGAWFTRIAEISNTVNAALRDMPTADFQADRLSRLGPMSEEAQRWLAGVPAFLNRTSIGAQKMNFSDFGVNIAAGQSDRVPSEEEGSKVAKIVVRAFSGLDLNNLKADTRHPLVSLQEMGSRIMGWAADATVVLAAASVLPIGALIAPIIGILIFSAVAGATILAVYTPMMPFILYLGAAIGWVVLVVEAMVAAPIWAVMHLNPDGDGMMGGAKQGYHLLLSLLLRPALIVFGFAAACFIIYPIGVIVNSIFFATFFSSVGKDTFYSIFMIVAGTAVYAGIMLSLLHKAFSLIHKLPDQLLQWLGGPGGTSLGGDAQEMDRGSKTVVAGVASQTQQLGTQAGTTGREFRQLDQARKTTAATEAEKSRALRQETSGALMDSRASATEADSASVKAGKSGRAEDHLTALQKNEKAADSLRNAGDLLEKSGDAQGATAKRDEARQYDAQAGIHRQALSDMGYKPGEAASLGASFAESNGAPSSAAAPTSEAPAGANAETAESGANANHQTNPPDKPTA